VGEGQIAKQKLLAIIGLIRFEMQAPVILGIPIHEFSLFNAGKVALQVRF
jgi:hypothetical protein